MSFPLPLLGGFRDELLKIAEETVDPEIAENIAAERKRLLGAAAGGVSGYGLQKGIHKGSMGIVRRYGEDPSMSRERIAPIVEEMRGQMGIKPELNVNVSPAWDTKALGPRSSLRIDPLSGAREQGIHVGPRVSEDILAHEVGHAKQMARPWAGLSGGVLQHSSRLHLPTSLATSAIAAGSEDPSWTPGLVNAAVHAPVLATEGGATLRGLRFLAKKHGLAKALRMSKATAGGFGTYASTAVAPFAITGGRKLYRRFADGGEESAAPST